MFLNRISLIGFLGNDAITRTANNASFTVLSLATKSSFKDKKCGEYNSRTEWHRRVVWGRLPKPANNGHMTVAATTKAGATRSDSRCRDRQDLALPCICY
jgi:hypothetical protein